MLHIENERVRTLLLSGEFGLEKENLRVRGDGSFSHRKNPFQGEKHIVRDFCENQIEMNTSVYTSAKEAVEALHTYNQIAAKRLHNLPEREYLWLFSNPPYIKNEEDVPIAVFEPPYQEKTEYREYLADKYGRYKMTLSGIHVNYSFSEELLRQDFKLSGESDFMVYKNRLYLDVAQQMAAYGWLLVAVTAASPLMDSSYVEKKVFDRDEFMGMASVRCSELGYWNSFSPILNYSDIGHYVDSIEQYLEDGILRAPSEFYYPIRLKPAGENTLKGLKRQGVNHIELRMFDLNPLCPEGVDVRDIVFAQLMLVWLASVKNEPLTKKDQVQAVQNYKNAAHYDLKTVKIVGQNGKICSVAEASLQVIDRMKAFYQMNGMDVADVLDFEYSKFEDANNRYAWQIREQFGNGFVKKAMELAKKRQEELVHQVICN